MVDDPCLQAARLKLADTTRQVLANGLGLLGVWLAMFCDWIVRAVCFLWRYWRGSWKKIHVI